MNPTTILAALLATSIIGNAWLTHAYLGQRDKATTKTSQAQQITTVAKECSQGTEALAKQATQRAAIAAPKIAAAQKQATQADRRADAILTTPPAAPGDDCKSAQARVDAWWAGRTTK